MHHFIKRMEAAVRNPYIELATGAVIIATGVSAAAGELIKDAMNGDFGAHHGVIVLGLAHSLKALPSALAALTMFAEAEKDAHNESDC